MAVEFFGAASPFGTLTDWEPQDGGGATKTKTRASALGADGDEFRHVDHNEKDSVSCTYAAKKTSGNFTIPKAGQVAGGYVIETLTLDYTQDIPTLTVSGHKHTNVATGAHANMRTYSADIDLPAVALGVPSAIGPVSCDGARSASFTLSCTHIDEPGGQDVIVGAENHDGVEQITVESVEDISVTDTNGDWTAESQGPGKTNSGATVNSLTLTKHIAHDTPNS